VFTLLLELGNLLKQTNHKNRKEAIMWSTERESRGAELWINGASAELRPGQNVKEALTQAARDAGLKKFRVFLNDQEIHPSEAPSTVRQGDKYEIRAYEVAG
jgi:hypothetical protein